MKFLTQAFAIITPSLCFYLCSIWYLRTDDAALASLLMLGMVLSGYAIIRALDWSLGFNSTNC